MTLSPALAEFRSEDAEEVLTINVTDRRGAVHQLPAIEGWRVMEVIRDWDLDIKAECGGACACATCHVYLGAEWVDRVPARNDDEDDMLDSAFDVQTNSRIACQLLMTPALDGLALKLAPGTDSER